MARLRLRLYLRLHPKRRRVRSLLLRLARLHLLAYQLSVILLPMVRSLSRQSPRLHLAARSVKSLLCRPLLQHLHLLLRKLLPLEAVLLAATSLKMSTMLLQAPLQQVTFLELAYQEVLPLQAPLSVPAHQKVWSLQMLTRPP